MAWTYPEGTILVFLHVQVSVNFDFVMMEMDRLWSHTLSWCAGWHGLVGAGCSPETLVEMMGLDTAPRCFRSRPIFSCCNENSLNPRSRRYGMETDRIVAGPALQ